MSVLRKDLETIRDKTVLKKEQAQEIWETVDTMSQQELRDTLRALVLDYLSAVETVDELAGMMLELVIHREQTARKN